MSEADLDVMRKWVDAWNRPDLDAFTGLFDADAEVVTDPSFPEPGPLRGRDAIRSFFEGLKQSWEADEVVVTELFGVGDKVIARWEWRARGRTSRIATTLDMTTVNAIDDGKTVWQQYFFDHTAALKAAGLSG